MLKPLRLFTIAASIWSSLWGLPRFSWCQSAPVAEPIIVGEKSGGGDRSAGGDQDGQEKANPRFVRMHNDAHGEPHSLDTELVHLRGPGPKGKVVEVDLVATIHVADRAYYEALNRRFKEYERLLYELVAPEGAQLPQAGTRSSSLSGLQVGMSHVLGLEFQLDRIDYHAANFVHADMTPDEFSASMSERGETALGMVLRVFRNSLAEQAKNPLQTTEKELLVAMFSKDRAIRLKRVVAREFSDVERMVAIHEGPGGSTLLTGRNEKALTVLRRELEAGRKKLAIYYGAAHMPDLEARLAKEFQLNRVGSEWLVAWDLAGPRPAAP